MNFPSTDKTFYFDHTTIFGNRYEGNFTIRCNLNVGQKHRLELEKTRLLGNYPNPTDELVGYAVVLANLRHKLTDAPNWWVQSRGGETIEEEEVLAELYAKLQEMEVEWRRELIEKAKPAETPASTT